MVIESIIEKKLLCIAWLKTTIVGVFIALTYQLTATHGNNTLAMPKAKFSRKKPPEGYELIEPTLDELDKKMREVENDPHEGKRKAESVWPIFRLHHQKSRYIYELFYKRKEISRELYDWCLKEGVADANLIAKWKKVREERSFSFSISFGMTVVVNTIFICSHQAGYERLCCLRCIQTRDHTFGSTCICRVPKKELDEGKHVECVHCGCRGCASGD